MAFRAVWVSTFGDDSAFDAWICLPARWYPLTTSLVPPEQWGYPGSADVFRGAADVADVNEDYDSADYFRAWEKLLRQAEAPAPAPAPYKPLPLPPGTANTPTTGDLAQQALDSLPEPYRSQVAAILDAGGPHTIGNLYTLALNLEASSFPPAAAAGSAVRALADALGMDPSVELDW